MADVYTWIITIRGIKSETKIILLVDEFHVDSFMTRQFVYLTFVVKIDIICLKHNIISLEKNRSLALTYMATSLQVEIIIPPPLIS